MPPNETVTDQTMDDFQSHVINNDDDEDKVSIMEPVEVDHNNGWLNFKTPVIWKNVVQITLFHVIALYGLLTFPILEHKLLTLWGKEMTWFLGLSLWLLIEEYIFNYFFKDVFCAVLRVLEWPEVLIVFGPIAHTKPNCHCV